MDEEALTKSNSLQCLASQTPGPPALLPQVGAKVQLQDIRHPQVLKIPTQPMQIIQRTTVVHGTGKSGQTGRPGISLLKDGLIHPKIEKVDIVSSPSGIQTNVLGVGPKIVQSPVQPVQTNQKLSSFRLIRTQTGELKLLNPEMVAQPLKVTSVVPSIKIQTIYPPSMKPVDTKRTATEAPKLVHAQNAPHIGRPKIAPSPSKKTGSAKATNPVLRHLLRPKFDTQNMKTHSKLKSKELTRIRKQKMKNLRKHIERKIQKKIDYRAIREKRKARAAVAAAATASGAASAASTSAKDSASTSASTSSCANIVNQHLNRQIELQQKEKDDARKAEQKEGDEKDDDELVVIIKDHNEKEVNLESHLSFAGTSVKPKFAIEFSPNNLQAYVQAVANAVDYHKNNPQPSKPEPKPKKKKKHKNREEEEEEEEEIFEPPPVIPSVSKSSRRKQTLCAREDPADSGVVIMQGPKGYDKLRKKKVPPKAKVVIPLEQIINQKSKKKRKPRKEIQLAVVKVEEEVVDVVKTAIPVRTGPVREVGVFIPPALAEPTSPELHPKLIIGKNLPNDQSKTKTTMQTKTNQPSNGTAIKPQSKTKPKEASIRKENDIRSQSNINVESSNSFDESKTTSSCHRSLQSKTPIQTMTSQEAALQSIQSETKESTDKISKTAYNAKAVESSKELLPVAVEEIKMESEDEESRSLKSPLDVLPDQSFIPLPEKLADGLQTEYDQPNEDIQSSDNTQPAFGKITQFRPTIDTLSRENLRLSAQSNEKSQVCEDFKLFKNVEGGEEDLSSYVIQESEDSQTSEDIKNVEMIQQEDRQETDDTSRDSSSVSSPVSLVNSMSEVSGRRVRKPSYKVTENIQVALLKALKKQKKERPSKYKPRKNKRLKSFDSPNEDIGKRGTEGNEKVPVVHMTTTKPFPVNVPESPQSVQNHPMVSLLKPHVLNQLKSESDVDVLKSIKEEPFETVGGSSGDLESLTSIANMKSPINLPKMPKSGRRKQSFNAKQDSTVHHSPAKESTALQNVKNQHEYIQQLRTYQQYCHLDKPVTVANGPPTSVIKLPVINAMRDKCGNQNPGVLVGPFNKMNQQNKQVYVVPNNVYTALLSAQATTGKQIKLSSNDLISGGTVLPLTQSPSGQGTMIQGALPNQQPQMNIVGTTNIQGIVSNIAGPVTNVIGASNIAGPITNIISAPNIAGLTNVVGTPNIGGMTKIVVAPNIVGTANTAGSSGAGIIGNMIVPQPSLSPKKFSYGRTLSPPQSDPTELSKAKDRISGNLNIKIDSVFSLNKVACKLMDKVPSYLDNCLSSKLEHSLKLCFVVLDTKLPPLVDGRTKHKRTRFHIPKVCPMECRAKCLDSMCRKNSWVNVNVNRVTLETGENFEPEVKKMKLETS